MVVDDSSFFTVYFAATSISFDITDSILVIASMKLIYFSKFKDSYIVFYSLNSNAKSTCYLFFVFFSGHF